MFYCHENTHKLNRNYRFLGISKTKDSIKKSLFFRCDGGKVYNVVDHDYDFDVEYLLPKGKTTKRVGFDYGYHD